MRIRSLRLQRYGHFDDESIQFGPGATVVHGCNEAGKSTLLDALGDFLWGIRAQSHPRAFQYQPKSMQLEGTVDFAGDARTYVRQLKHLRNAQGDDTTPPWDPDLTRDAKGWESMFGLTLDRLQDGGRQVIEGKGDLADLIFLAETGEMIRKVRDELTARMDAIYKERRNASCEVRARLDDIDDLTMRLQDSEASAADVMVLRNRIRANEEELDSQRLRRLDLEREQRKVAELIKCLPDAARLRELEAQRESLRAAGVVLPPDMAEELRDALGGRKDAQESIDKLEPAVLNKEDELRSLPQSPELLAAEDEIQGLHQSLEARREDKALLDTDVTSTPRAAVIDALRALGYTATTDLGKDVRSAWLAEATRARLTDLARDILDLQKQVKDKEKELAEADVEPEDSEEAEDSPLIEVRKRRDASWHRIREPWLSGQLPGDGERRRLADDLDQALVRADETAEQMAEQLEEAATQRGMAEQKKAQKDKAAARVAELREQQKDLLDEWQSIAEACGLPPGVDATVWGMHNGLISDLQTKWNELERQEGRVADARTRWNQFCDQVRDLDALPAPTHANPLKRVEALSTALADAKEANTRADEIEKELKRLRKELEEARETQRRDQQVIEELTKESAESPEGLVRRAEQVQEAVEEIDNCTELLKRAKDPETTLESLLADLATTDTPELEARQEEADASLKTLEESIADLTRGLTLDREDLKDLESRDSAADLHARRIAEGEKLRALVEEYRSLRLQVELLDAFSEDLSTSSDSPVLDDAGAFLATLTSGRYTGFAVIEDGDERRLEVRLAESSGEGTARLRELSLGTADQVFLALRLAGIKAKQKERVRSGLPTLPVVLDDVLVAHDDQRSRAALEVMAVLGEDMQTILMTHHESVRTAASTIEGVTCAALAALVAA